MTNEQRANYIAGLIHERDMFAKRGDQDGVDQVNAQLRKLGHEGAPAQKRAEKRPATRAKAKETR